MISDPRKSRYMHTADDPGRTAREHLSIAAAAHGEVRERIEKRIKPLLPIKRADDLREIDQLLAQAERQQEYAERKLRFAAQEAGDLIGAEAPPSS